jgi:hypothetical protein
MTQTVAISEQRKNSTIIGGIDGFSKEYSDYFNAFLFERYKQKNDTFSTEKEDLSLRTDNWKLIDLCKFEPGIPYNWLKESLECLDNIYLECSKENWDGYGSNPITQETYFEAKNLLELLQTSFPIPEICPEPNGGIGIEWYKKRGCSFIISVSGKNIITYAGLFGEGNQTHGTEHFTNSVPKIILNFLMRLFSNS